MSDAYVGEIRLFGFPRTPSGWFACDGSLKSIADFQVLFTLIGTTYGGNGVTDFAIPDLRGRIPVHMGTLPGGGTYPLGQQAGTEQVTVLTSQMPAHDHGFLVSTTTATAPSPGNTLMLGTLTNDSFYAKAPANAASPLTLGTGVVTTAGGNQPHANVMRTRAVQYCICWSGLFPPRAN